MIKYRFLITYLITGLIAYITYLVYRAGLHGPFVFDDLSNILLVKTTYLKELSFSALKNTAMGVDSGPLHRPIAILSFGLNYYFTGLDVYYFKLTNLIIHIAAGFLIYRLSYYLLNQHTLNNASDKNYTTARLNYTGLAVAAAWLLHPLDLTSVLYVVQRMTSLASLFTLMGLVGYAIGRGQIIRGKFIGFITITISILLFGTLSTLTKEIGVILPLYILLIEVYFYRMVAAEGFEKRFAYFFCITIILPLILGLCVAVFKADTLLALDGYQYRNFTLIERLMTESRVLWFYLKLIVVPTINALGTYHDDFSISTGLLSPISTLLSITALAAMFALIIVGYRRATILSFGLAWFLIGHSLESTIVPLELVHEHRNYLPQFGIILIIVYYLAYPAPTLRKTLNLRLLAILSYASLLAIITYARSEEWKDEWTLFNAEAKSHPKSSRSHTALAVLYNDNKMYKEAGEHFQLAADLQKSDLEPTLRLAQFELGRKNNIPEPILRRIEYQIEKYNTTSVSFSIFDDLLRSTQKDPEQLAQVIDLYEKLTKKYETLLEKKWKLIAYRTLAENYDIAGEHSKSIRYFMLTTKMDPRAYYYIKAAIQYAKQKNVAMADQMIIIVANEQLPVTDTDKALLDNLSKLLAHQS